MILSGAMLLRHIGDHAAATAVEQAVRDTLADGTATTDLGGKSTTDQFADAVIVKLQA
jgi:isocitrate/isopropylmalate dehydrogenase